MAETRRPAGWQVDRGALLESAQRVELDLDTAEARHLRSGVEVLIRELEAVEAVLVAADRVREAYDAMLAGRDVGRLPDWQPTDG